MLELFVHSHALVHGLLEEDVQYAWENFVKSRPRGMDYEVRIGFDSSGRELGMVGAKLQDGDVLIFHAKTPPIPSIKKELGEQSWNTH